MPIGMGWQRGRPPPVTSLPPSWQHLVLCICIFGIYIFVYSICVFVFVCMCIFHPTSVLLTPTFLLFFISSFYYIMISSTLYLGTPSPHIHLIFKPFLVLFLVFGSFCLQGMSTKMSTHSFTRIFTSFFILSFKVLDLISFF